MLNKVIEIYADDREAVQIEKVGRKWRVNLVDVQDASVADYKEFGTKTEATVTALEAKYRCINSRRLEEY